jgi:protocatechuate 3,4-dioxygenase, alpha subunit
MTLKTPMLEQTPSQTVGPFFHYGLIFGGENVLVNDLTRGKHIVVTGRVFDGDGAPIPDAMIEIWQADAQGIFNHPNDPNHANADPNFHGFGRADTRDSGRFVFKTIKPGAVMGHDGNPQASHLNVHVFSRGVLIHATTRLYFSDEPANETDALLSTIPESRRHTLIATLQHSNDVPTYQFDIHLQGENETVFFA